MMYALTLSVLLMAGSPNAVDGRVAAKSETIHYTEDAPREHDVDFSLVREGTAQVVFKRFKRGCADEATSACWNAFGGTRTLTPDELDPLLATIDAGKWKYFSQQVTSAPGEGAFSLEVTSKRGTKKKEGSIYDAMAYAPIARFRKQLLDLMNAWYPPSGGHAPK